MLLTTRVTSAIIEDIMEELDEAKIRVALWMSKQNKTKKSICEYLGIPYNTKKLDKIFSEFQDREQRLKVLRENARKTPLTQSQKESIVSRYNNKESLKSIAEDYFISSQKVTSVLKEMNVPLRGRGKKSTGKVEHITQDLDSVIPVNSKVFSSKNNCYGIVKQVYDEAYAEYLQSGKITWVETGWYKNLKEDQEPIEHVHYELYMSYPDGKSMLLNAAKHLIELIHNYIEETGREYYSVYCEDRGFIYASRKDLVLV